MNDKVEIRMSESFKSDVRDAAESRNQSMSEFMREATRGELQRVEGENDE